VEETLCESAPPEVRDGLGAGAVGPAEALGGHGLQTSHRIRTLGSDPQPCAGCTPSKIPPVSAASCAGGLPVQLVGAPARRGKDGMRPMLLGRLLGRWPRAPFRHRFRNFHDSRCREILYTGPRSVPTVWGKHPRRPSRDGVHYLAYTPTRRPFCTRATASAPVLPRSHQGPLHHGVTMSCPTGVLACCPPSCVPSCVPRAPSPCVCLSPPFPPTSGGPHS